MKYTGIYLNLLAQFDKLFAHNRQGSYKTRERYADAFRRFLRFVAEEYRLERLPNLAPKHLYAYVSLLTEKGLAAATIKTDLAAIRFFHDQIPNAKYKLPGNDAFLLQRRRFGGVDRTWSGRDFNLFLLKALELRREDYVSILSLARYAALRLHECFRIDTAMAERAVKSRVLTIKGKGGLVREVPINETIFIELQKLLAVTPRGQKLFVAPDDKTHLAMRRMESFIHYHRMEIQEPDTAHPLTFHGLRHTCAAEWYEGLLAKGCTEFQARKKVARLLGHGRDDVTRVYLASLETGGGLNV